MAVDERDRDAFFVAEPLKYGMIDPPKTGGPAAAGVGIGRMDDDDPHDERRTSEGVQAVLVIHGMGQQATFDTLSEVADGLANEEAKQNRRVVAKRARRVHIGDQALSRVELVTADGGERREIHVYEAYWAPLTEGRVSLRDVMLFLLRAGLSGLRRGRTEFRRWAFGDMQPYRAVRKTPIYLLLALTVVGALILIDTVVGLTAMKTLWKQATWQTPLIRDLNMTLSFLAATLTSFGAVLISANRWKRLARASDRFGVMLGRFGWLHAAVVALALVATAVHSIILVARGDSDSWWQSVLGERFAHVALATLIASILAIGAIAFASLARSESTARWVVRLALLSGVLSIFAPLAAAIGWTAFAGGPVGVWSVPWAWFLIVAATFTIRRLLVEYLGDVAAYVSPQTLDKFCELREEIRARVFAVGKAVYGAAAQDGSSLYGGVTVVGHSLGSVAAYDLLNRLTLEDSFNGDSFAVRRRTNALITFGSPLDKTAFLFSLHHPRDTAYALAATVQPMIDRYQYRPYRWINVYSRHDIISGSLDYYDRPGAQSTRRVINEEDHDATIPLLAHVEYWNNRTLWNRVLGSLCPVARYDPTPPKKIPAMLAVPDAHGA